MTAFEQAIGFTLQWEGGYSNHPADRGGPTRYGITQQFARDRGYTGDMRSLPLALAHKWYKEDIWDRFKFEEVADISPECAGYLFDMAVNHGKWALIAQRAAARYFPGIEQDGKWGPETHGALQESSRYEGFLDALRVERCRYGNQLVASRRSQAVFLVGWLRRWLA